jgi:integrase
LGKDWTRAQTGKHELLQHPSRIIFWLFAVRCASETRLRLSDIAQLEWRCFGEAGKIVVWTEKTNRRMEFPVSEAVGNLITDIPVNDADFVFPEQRALIRDPKKRSGLSVEFARLLERLDIKGKSFHSLRHFRASKSYANLDKEALAAKLASALSMNEIKQLLGHASSKTTQGYVHH